MIELLKRKLSYLIISAQDKNLWEIISEGFNKGVSWKSKFLAIYFSAIVLGSALTYYMYKRIFIRIQQRKFENTLIKQICFANGIEKEEEAVLREIIHKTKSNNKFSVFVSRKTLDDSEKYIKNPGIKQKLINKLYNSDEQGNIKENNRT